MTKYEKIAMDESGNAIFQVINSQNGEVEKVLTPQDKGLWREKEFCILFQRTALNPLTMKNISAWFIQKILYKMPNRDGYDYHYFAWEKHMSLPCCRILDSRMGQLAGLTFQVTVTDKDFVRKTAQPKRLTKEQVQKILKDKQFESLPFLGIFNEQGEEYVAPKSD
ncbi:MAG TPA: hypothetical protein VI864_06780 [Candidatus Bathyarchaeia archaeon]|nr:hypothetical protein [Candidatus Bathyarchaeia archaeon]